MKFSKRASNIKTSEIREILKLIENPEIISFAGGLPAPELFPKEEIIKLTAEVINNEGNEALQYGTTEGYNPLRKAILEQRLNPFGITGTIDNILITSGSQQGLDFTGKLFIDKDDVIIVEKPSYLGAINAFRVYEAQFVEVSMDKDGMIIEELEEKLKLYPNAKFIYTIPDFHNPSGITMSLERRKQLADIANKYKVPVLEDSPYGELVLEGEKLPPIKSFDTDGYVIYFGTFSKTFCPGLRLGWIFGDEKVIYKYVTLKQSSDLQCSSLDQRIIAYYLNSYNLDEHIERIKSVYRKRRDLMFDCMDEFLPKEIKYTRSKGGLFTWLELRENIDTVRLLEEALKFNVAFVPGSSFFANGGHNNYLRLNYSNMPEDKIVEGIKRLSKLLKEYYKES
ncbi:PLP-dependent aminotransferase family protein [Clostridium folliculivorans]|uniref:Aminotransferase n=1 Tax=Clostridium folliculivorans TaxID=2886038 RepID=A0A9W5Y100_9CLOT|nr:PLP-dependent aminotransferase family protein [Clostridium folliculivorans]GKU24711.1 aminotransferase [Clostridium folliculivorans]GKU30809.1 aminotransferase [Clostridium folliculivorans]